MRVICRECNNEIDTSSGYPEHELMDHYNIFHKNLMVRCTKCMQRIYSGYHFKDRCIDNRTGLISSLHSYIDYINIYDNDSNDNIDINKDDKDDKNYDLNNVLNELKDDIKEDLKEYIKTNLKQEINELKLEIKNEIKKEVKNEIEGGAINNLKTDVIIKNPSKQIKSTRTCCFCKIEKNRDCFYKTGGLCKECSSEKVQCQLCNIFLNRSSLRKHMKRPHIN